MKKKIPFIFVLVFLVMCFAQVASANTGIKEFGKKVDLIFEGRSLNFDKGTLRDVNGTLMVPLREFAPYMGVTVKKTSTNTVTATKHDTSIEFTIESKIAILNKKNVTLPSAPTIVDGVTYVPFKFLTDKFEHKLTYNQYIGEAVVIQNIPKIKPVLLTSKDYEIEYYDDEFYELDINGYFHGITIYEDYYKTQYPNAVYYKWFTLHGIERENGIKMDDLYTDTYFSELSNRRDTLNYTLDWEPIYQYYIWGAGTGSIWGTKTADQHIDHYIALFDINHKFIDLLFIPIEVPKEKLHPDFTFTNPNYNSISPLKTAPTVLNNFSISSLPILEWDYVTNDFFPNYITYRNNVTLSSNYTSGTFKSDKNHYITTISRNEWEKLNGQTFKFDFLEGLEVNFTVKKISSDYRFITHENAVEIESMYFEEKALTGKQIKLNFDPYTTKRIEINVEMYNPETYVTNKYQFIIEKTHYIVDLFNIKNESFRLIEPLLPNDIVSITIPASLTSTKKPIYINFKYGTTTKEFYEFKNYTNSKVILDTPNQTSNIKIRIKRGDQYLYDTSYKYDTHPLPVIDGAKYKIIFNQYDQLSLGKNKESGGFARLYAGVVDLSAIPNAKYALHTYEKTRPIYADYVNYIEKYPIKNVPYKSGLAFPRLEYTVYRVQEEYFILFDEDKYPLALVKTKLTLKEGYVHKIVTTIQD